MSAVRPIYDFLKKTGLWIPLILWLVLYPWKPFLLGFYYDDWIVIVDVVQSTVAFSWDRFQALMTIFADRPGMGILFFIACSFLNDSWMAWHIFISLVVLGTVTVFYYFLRRLFQLLNYQSWQANYASALACSLWLCLPWLKGVENWPTIWCVYPLTALFALTGERLFNGWRQGKSPVWMPSLLFLSQALMYEIYYFQFILFFLFGAIAGVFKTISKKALLVSLTGLSIVQGITILINRASSPREFSWDWLSLFQGSLKHLPSILLKSAAEVKPYLVVSFIVLLVLCLAGYFYSFFQKRQSNPNQARKFILTGLGVILTCILGAVMSIGILSMGSRHIIAMGTFARSTLSFSFWWMILWAFLFYCLFFLPKYLRWIGITGIASTLILLSIASVMRTLDFAKSWEWQKRIVQTAPMDKIHATDHHAVILFNGPIHENWVYIFYESYPLSGAMSYFHPELRIFKNKADRIISGTSWKPFLVQANYETTWTGKEVIQRGANHFHASELWLWDYYTGEFKQITSPTTFPKRSLELH